MDPVSTADAREDTASVSDLLTEFGGWLDRQRGLAPITIHNYCWHAGQFLAALPWPAQVSVSLLNAGTVTAFMVELLLVRQRLADWLARLRRRWGLVGRRTPGLGAKNLLGLPWRVALALQDDGWIIRNAIVWNKPNAMPESVRDRLNCRYELIFLLVKSRSYWFDLDPIRVPHATPRAPRGCAGSRRPPGIPATGRHPGDGLRGGNRPGGTRRTGGRP